MPEETAVIESAPDAAQLASFMDAGAAFTKNSEPKPEAAIETVAPPAKPVPAKPVEPAKTEAKPEQAIPEQILTGEKPDPKPDPVKVEEDAVLAAEPPPNLSKAAAVNWQNMRDTAKRVASERDQIRKDFETAKAEKAKAGPDEQTVAQLKAATDRAAELERIVERSAFEQSPRFQKFLTREKQNIDGAKAYLEGTEINPNVVDLAARSTGSQRLKILRDAGVDAETIASISPYLADIDRVNAEKAAEIENHKAFREQDAAQEKAQQEAVETQRRENDERVFKQVRETIATLFTPFQKVDGQDKWNAQVDLLNQEAREMYEGKLSFEKTAEGCFAAVAYKVEAQINQSLREQLKAARTENASLKAAQPDGGTQPPSITHNANEPWNQADVAGMFERAKQQAVGG